MNRDGAIVNERFYMSDGLSNDLGQVTDSPEISAAPKMVSQDEVEKIVHAAKMREREKAAADIERVKTEAQSRLPAGVGGSAISREDIDAMVDAKLQGVLEKAGQKAVAQKIMNDFTAKMASGYEKYPDFQDKMADFGLADVTELVQLATNTENTADVMYELASNVGKAGSILSLYQKSPRLAMKAVAELSKSIKDNEAAKGGTPSKPLSQIKPTTTAVDSGTPSVQDYYKQSWIRK